MPIAPAKSRSGKPALTPDGQGHISSNAVGVTNFHRQYGSVLPSLQWFFRRRRVNVLDVLRMVQVPQISSTRSCRSDLILGYRFLSSPSKTLRCPAPASSSKYTLAVAPATMLYVDPSRQRIRLPSQDITAFAVDAFLLIVHPTAMQNHCRTPSCARSITSSVRISILASCSA